MIKSQVQRIVREVATTQGATLTRDEKWSVFLNVCDGLYRHRVGQSYQYLSQ